MVSFSGLGKAITTGDGRRVQVYNRLNEQVGADMAGSYCPFNVVDLWGSTIDLSGWAGGYHEVMCCTMNGAITPGTWNQQLYRDGTKVFDWDLNAPSGWECLYWFIGNGETSKNGNYKWEFRAPGGSLIKTYDFTIINAPVIQTPKACISMHKPGASGKWIVGEPVTVQLDMRNCGDLKGYIYARIYIGEEKAGKMEEIEPDGVVSIGYNFAMPPNESVPIDFYGWHWNGDTSKWVFDISKRITLTPKVPTAKGQIIAHNINKLPCPDCGSAEEGQEIEVIAGMKNVGEVEGKFRFYVYDQDGNMLSKEPDGVLGLHEYKNVKPGDTWSVSKTLTTNLNFNMPNYSIVKGRLELVRQT